VGARPIDEGRVASCLALMRRRGPDSSGFRHFVNVAGRHVYLLNSRLSIIDLDVRANQPFAVAETWITCNGELYNNRELRHELAASGYRFRTESDVEVLLAAMHMQGPEVLDRCEGMWAFASYDGSDGAVTLSRDRFGEKPLYLHRADEGLYFGSEPKFIAALRGARLAPNVDHLRRYLVNGYK